MEAILTNIYSYNSETTELNRGFEVPEMYVLKPQAFVDVDVHRNGRVEKTMNKLVDSRKVIFTIVILYDRNPNTHVVLVHG